MNSAAAKDITVLIERLRSSTDNSDKHDALTTLSELSESSPYEVGAGIPVLIDALRQCTSGRLGSEAGGMVMEILENLVSGRGAGDMRQIAAAANAARLVDTHENVVALLDVLEGGEVATACGAVGVLRTLHDASPASLEATVLECPAGMQRLLDILASAAESASEEMSASGGGSGGASEKEPLRNAALELWEQLTRTNADMKTFLALAEGFEHLAAIVSAEDDCRGPISKDCLAVALNVVAGGSYQAQGLLCQSGFLRALPPLFELPMKESKVRLLRGNSNNVMSTPGGRDDASAATSGSEWDSDESVPNSDESDGYDSEDSQRRRSSSRPVMRVAWLLPLSHDALKAIELALSVVHSVVANAEKKPALPEGTASQKGSEEDENVLKVLAEREATARAQRCAAVWGEGVNGSVGLALLRFALPPPPPPPFLALPPPLLWAKAVQCLAQLCCHSSSSGNQTNNNRSSSSALRALSEEAHVSAAPLPHPAALTAAAVAASAEVPNGVGQPPSTPSGHNSSGSGSIVHGWSSTGISLIGSSISSSQVSFGPDVTLSGLGCAVRWLLLGPHQVSAALAASADASRCGGPPGSKHRRKNRDSPTNESFSTGALTASLGEGGAAGANNDDDAEHPSTMSEADQGCRAVLGAMLSLVATAATAEGPGGCLMAVHAGVMPEMPPMESPGGVVSSGPPIPPVRMCLQALASSADVVVSSSLSSSSSSLSSSSSVAKESLVLTSDQHSAKVTAAGSAAAACRILRLLLQGGGEGAKQLALKASVPLRQTLSTTIQSNSDNHSHHHSSTSETDTGSISSSFTDSALLDAVLRWIEAAITREHADDGNDASSSSGGAEGQLAVSLLSLLAVWLHNCPLAVAALLEQPENLFLVEIAAGANAGSSSSSSPRTSEPRQKCQAAVRGLATLVLGVCMEETLAGEHARRDARQKAVAKARANYKAARALQKRTAAAAAAGASTQAAEEGEKAEEVVEKVSDEGTADDNDNHGNEDGDDEDDYEGFEEPKEEPLDPNAWTSEALQRTIVGRVGFGKFSRMLAQLVQVDPKQKAGANNSSNSESFSSSSSLVVAEADEDPWSLGGAGFAAFVKVRVPAVQAALVEAYRSVGGGGAEAEAKAEADALREKVAQLEQVLLEKDQQLSSLNEKAQHVNSSSSSGGGGGGSKDDEAKDSSCSPGDNSGAHNGQSEGEEEGSLSLIERERAAWVAERAGLAQQMEALRVEVGGTERILAEAADRVAFLEREAASAGTAGFNEGQAEGLAQGIAQAEATAAEQQAANEANTKAKLEALKKRALKAEKAAAKAAEFGALVEEAGTHAASAQAAWQSERNAMTQRWDEERQALQQILKDSSEQAHRDMTAASEREEHLRGAAAEALEMRDVAEKRASELAEQLEESGASASPLSLNAAVVEGRVESAAREAGEAARLEAEAKAATILEARLAEATAAHELAMSELKAEVERAAGEARATRSLLAEREADLQEVRESLAASEEMCEQEVAKAEAASAALAEQSAELTRRAEGEAHESIAHEALQQEVRSLKEERDRLHAAIAAAEDDVSSLSREKARFMQQSDEAENALERCRAEMATLKKSHQSELESCRKDRSTWQAQASDLQQQLETALASATSAETSHQQALASCEFKHSAAIAALEAEHANKLAEAARAAKASSGGDNHKGGSNGNDGDAEVASSSGTAMQQLQQQLDNALRDLASANARCAAAEVSAAEAVTSRQSSQASLEAQIADLNRKLVNTDAKAKQAMADAEEEWTRRVEDLESDLAAAQAAQDAERLKVDSLRRELTSAASEAEAQRLNAKEKREAEMAKGRAALRIAEDANVALRSETAAQLMAMQEDHTRALKLLQDDCKASLATATAEHAAEQQRLKEVAQEASTAHVEASARAEAAVESATKASEELKVAEASAAEAREAAAAAEVLASKKTDEAETLANQLAEYQASLQTLQNEVQSNSANAAAIEAAAESHATTMVAAARAEVIELRAQLTAAEAAASDAAEASHEAHGLALKKVQSEAQAALEAAVTEGEAKAAEAVAVATATAEEAAAARTSALEEEVTELRRRVARYGPNVSSSTSTNNNNTATTPGKSAQRQSPHTPHSASRRVNFGEDSPSSPNTPRNGGNTHHQSNNNAAATPSRETASVRKAFDEEKVRFAELSEEHADLLALLAQQEVVMSLVEAKLKQVNVNAFTQAKREAERRCVQEFGLYIATGGDGAYDEDGDGLHGAYEEGYGDEMGLQNEFEAVAEEASDTEHSDGESGNEGTGGANRTNGNGLFGVNDDYSEFDDDLKDL